ncbi:hypothetical protein BU14_1698s0001 [Porphyra umbilicalis]|uniref:N-acetyltransferase domain-containing protein n=1 Tax=Porphyra umbilicalis TaxID=2786 RepID=A0A1X6NKV7_PORUM|nr:hypothetical protein BU14_1698s0001 [Porphyra umbilicalis]|eukprot:OSX69244.1 hypothetical protein BU14_1698s0001 [Porphyra umbilicalis]
MASSATGAAPPTLSDAIEHDTDRCVFSLAATRPATAALPGAAKPTAVLEYARLGNGDLDLQHTFVPPDMRGMGAAALLCHSAFAHARAAGVRVVPSCSYISQTYLSRYPQQADVVRPAA